MLLCVSVYSVGSVGSVGLEIQTIMAKWFLLPARRLSFRRMVPCVTGKTFTVVDEVTGERADTDRLHPARGMRRAGLTLHKAPVSQSLPVSLTAHFLPTGQDSSGLLLASGSFCIIEHLAGQAFSTRFV